MWRAFTWLRKQKRRGRRHEKKYLPQRITQEKHQLSRVMLTPRVCAWGSGVSREGPAAPGRRVGDTEEEGERPAPGVSRIFSPGGAPLASGTL